MNDSDSDIAPARSRRRYVRWVVLGVGGLVVLAVGAILLYAFVLNDSPDALDAEDLGNALSATVPVATTDATTDATTNTTTNTAGDGTVAPATTAPDGTTPASFDGDWAPTDASEFGYRVDEVLAGVNTTAVGRSNEIDGLLTIEGTTATVVDIEVLIENITSDDGLRDEQFRGRIMDAEQFPTATFRLTEPIEFGTIPTGDERITAAATGELTLRGTTNPVSFEVTAQTTDGRIGVLGDIPVVFEDYGIPNPSIGPIRTEDNGLVEFVLVFEPVS